MLEVVEGLFPQRVEHVTVAGEDGEILNEGVPPVTEAELVAAVLRIRGRNTAPGPGGIPARVLVLALDHMSDRLRELSDVCLTSGRFPDCWKSGKLVLLLKPGRPADSVAAYGPIVLLDEAGKTARIIQHLCEVGPDLSDA